MRRRAGVLAVTAFAGLWFWFSVSGEHHRLDELSTNAPDATSSKLGAGSFTRRIVAVGDLHGDLPNAHKVLRMADVVDDDWNWSGKVDYFVQTGDIVDR
jgi:predicted MPP superfamily phosphohydrolase